MLTKSAVSTTIVLLLCSITYAGTLTFDEIPSGTILQFSEYAYYNRVSFSEEFRATNHVGWPWGTPHSGTNVLTSVEQSFPEIAPFIHLGYFGPHDYDPDPVLSVAAFFSTQTDAIITVTAYREFEHDFVPVDTEVIGAIGESWDNRLVALSTTPDLPFELIRFEGVNSPDDLLGFCLDDMTITLVPEPSSLLALAGGLMGLGLLCKKVNSKR